VTLRRTVGSVTAMTRTYVVECYSPAIDRQAVESSARRARAAAAELQCRGRRVEYVGALFVPGDEVVFYLFAASSLGPVREASRRAGVEFERVSESIPIGVDLSHTAAPLEEVSRSP
jgi:hypothetical protein